MLIKLSKVYTLVTLSAGYIHYRSCYFVGPSTILASDYQPLTIYCGRSVIDKNCFSTRLMTVLQPLRRVCFLAERYFLLLLRLYNVNCFSLVVFNYWLCVIVVVSYVSSAACFIHGVIFQFFHRVQQFACC